ncbi:MAG: BlaI/MecI/CopY family transcriptional regulator [Planctomyces sp.]
MDTLTQAEMVLLRELWKQKSSAIRELAETIYGSSVDSKTAAVLKLLQRMMAKGFVKCCRESRPHVYTPAITEQQYLQLQLQELADQHCDGKLAPLATTLLQTKGFNQRQRRQLRELIDQLWPDDTQGTTGGKTND